MNFKYALEALKNGLKIKLPHWKGYWKLENGKIMMHCKDGSVINLQDTNDIIYTLSNIASDEWCILDDDYNLDEPITTMRFGEALRNLKLGKRVARQGWNGKGIYIEMQIPDENSKMTLPYIYIVTKGLVTDNPKAPKGVCPWIASQTDMLAEDWIIV